MKCGGGFACAEADGRHECEGARGVAKGHVRHGSAGDSGGGREEEEEEEGGGWHG